MLWTQIHNNSVEHELGFPQAFMITMKTQYHGNSHRSSRSAWNLWMFTRMRFLEKLIFISIIAANVFVILVFFTFHATSYKDKSNVIVRYEIQFPENRDVALEQKVVVKKDLPQQSYAEIEERVKNSLKNSGINYTDDILQVLRSLEEPTMDTDYSHIFKGDLLNKTTWEFDFSEISKRRFGRNFVELTSADQEGRNTDFFNPLYVHGRTTVVFEDYGPGILERLLLYRRMENPRKDINYIIIEVDGEKAFYAKDSENSPEKTFPFKEPLFRPSRKKMNTGYLINFPIAYEKSIRVSVHWIIGPEYKDDEIWNITIACKSQSKHCPIGVYFAASCNKLVHGAKMKNTFNDYFRTNSHDPHSIYLKNVTNAIAEMASSPQKFGPGMKKGCELICRKIYSGGPEVVIYSAKNTSQVIQSILLRVYDVRGRAVMSKNWKTMLITMTWDDKEPQVREIPLAGLFTNGMDYLREVRSLTAGVRMKTCHSRGHRVKEMRPRDWLAYLFYEMPFWQSARITIRRLPGHGPGVICSQVNTKPLDLKKYNPRLTGYFSVQLNQQLFGITHNKPMLRLEEQWGHVVALNFFLKNTKVAYTQENDVIIEIDQVKVPTISGTGMEDYFDYVHSFADFVNTSSILNGVPFFHKVGRFRQLRCYRHMLLDPVLFTTGILIYLEGYWERIKHKVYRNFREPSQRFNETIQPDSLLSVVLYYGNKGNGGIMTHMVHYEKYIGSATPNIRFTPPEVDKFQVKACFENQPHIEFARIVVSMKPGQSVMHTFTILPHNVGVILRREYFTVVANQKAHVEVDGRDAGLWFCPQRAISRRFSLRLSDYHLPPRLTVGKRSIKVTFRAVTQWESISVKVISIVLLDQ